MKRRKKLIINGCTTVAAAALFACGVPLLAAGAAAPNAANAIRVSPALSNIQLSAGETSATVAASVSNLTSAPLVVALSARDFGVSFTSASAIRFYGLSYNPATNPHGLQAAISFAAPEITLAPKTTQKIAITLNNVARLAAGGHYGAVLFSPAPRAALGKHAKVSIHSAVASLIFLKTASGGTQTLRLLPLYSNPIRLSLPVTSYIAFKDTGNTQSAPQGQLTLYGPSGSIVGTTVINPGSGLILPGTSRLFTVGLPVGRQWLMRPGMYRLELQYRDSSQKTFTVVNQRFLYLNLVLILPALLVLLLVVYTLKRRGGKLLRAVKRLASWILKYSRKRTASEPPQKPKKSRPLIQG